MKKTWSFFRTKIFYVALAVGLVAFASLVAVYNYQDAKEELNQGQAIDLNQPVDNNLNLDSAVGQNDEADNSKEPVTQIGKPNESTTEAKTTEKSTEETTEEVTEDVAAGENEDDTAPASSNSAQAAPQLNYNGEQELAWPLVGDVILPFSMETTEKQPT